MKIKKLIPALCLLLVSAILLGTSTYAWFSMNTTVSATAMQVKAKSNNTFLLINTGDNDTYAEIQTAAQTTIPLTVSDLQSQVYPAMPVLPANVAAEAVAPAPASGTYVAYGTTAITTQATAAAAANWRTAQNNNPAASHDSVKNINALNTTVDDTYEFSKYVIKRTAYLTLAEGSEDANNLTVTPTINIKAGETATDITAVKVLVVTSADNLVVLDSSMNGVAQNLHATANTTLTDDSVVTVDIYIYYDGHEAAVNTNNAADLAAATITLAFDVAVA